MSNIRELSQLASVIQVDDGTRNVGIGTTKPKEALTVVGVVSATSFYGDGSNLSGISAGIGSTGSINTTGIITASTFYGNLTGTATSATNLIDAANITTGTISSARLSGSYNINVAGSAGYATTAGVSTSVIGGIGSITSLNVSGISTFGTVQIFSGIVTATSGIVTYYGDGSKLNNIISGVGIRTTGGFIGYGITTLNFIGAGNTFAINGNTVDISISGGSVSGVVTSIIAGSGISVTQSAGIVTVSVVRSGDIRILDNISDSFNGVTTSFTITSSGGALTPTNSQSLIVSIGGVIQKPITDYYVSTNNIIFTTAPASNLSFFGIYFDLNLLGSNGRIDVIDDISGSFNGITTSFAITSSGGAISPNNTQALVVNLGGVIQSPSVDYNINGSNIIFTTAPSSSLSFSGVHFNVSSADNTVLPRMLSLGGPWWNNLGNLGVGTTNPISKLQVQGDVKVVGVITCTDIDSTSDINLKTNIKPIENSLEKILQINGVAFDWKETQQPSMGVIAQELERVFPELVKQSDSHKSVNYNGLIGVLIEAIKEQQKQIEELKLSK